MKRNGTQSGFTLVELLVVMTVIVILMGFLLVTIFGANTIALRTKAETEIRGMYMAIESFKVEHMRYPQTNNNSGLGYWMSNREFISGSAGTTEGLLYEDGTTNSIVPYFSFDHEFLRIPGSDTANTCLLDPWEQPYIYVNRTVYNAAVNNDGNTEIETEAKDDEILIFSAGPDNFISSSEVFTKSLDSYDDWEGDDGVVLPIFIKK